jgi:hypothetical protein
MNLKVRINTPFSSSLTMNKNKITALGISLLAAALALGMIVNHDLVVAAYAQADTSAAKLHLEAGIKALQGGDKQGAMAHLNAADQALNGMTSTSAQTGKMHLDQGIKALQSGDQQGALMHVSAAAQAL